MAARNSVLNPETEQEEVTGGTWAELKSHSLGSLSPDEAFYLIGSVVSNLLFSSEKLGCSERLKTYLS